jgi:hypothetical protein
MANRYWVGGTAAWDGTAGTKWAELSGGAGGFAIPTSADDVFFDAASGAVTCTISTGNTGAKSITCTGFTGTLAGTAALSVSGSVTLAAGMTRTYTGTLSIIATGTITSAGITFGPITVNGSGITVTLGDAVTSSSTTTLTQGTLSLNGFTLTTSTFSSNNSNTRAITFGTANIALTGSGTIISAANAANLSTSGTGGFTRNQATTATITFGTSGANGVNIAITAGSAALTITATSYIKRLDFTGSTCAVTGEAEVVDTITLASGGTYTGFSVTLSDSQTLTSFGKTLSNVTFGSAFSGNSTLTLADALTVSGTFTLFGGLFGSNVLDLNGFTLSTGVFSSSSAFARAIAFGTGGNIALTSTTAGATVLDLPTLGALTLTGTGGFTRVQNATATINVGNSSAGLPANAPNFTVTSGASALTITSTGSLGAFTLTGSTCSVTGAATINGALTLASGGVYAAFSPTLAATQTFNSLGKTLSNFGVSGAGIVVTLGDALSTAIAGATTLTQGTLDLNGFTLSTGAFSSSNTNTRAIAFGTGNIALISTTAATTVLSMATATGFTTTGTGGFTRNQAATATVSFGNTAGGSASNAPNLTVNAGASTLTVSNNSWFRSVDFTGSTCSVSTANINVAGSLTFATGGTYTLTSATCRGTGTLTSNGKTFTDLSVNGSGITVTCADAITLTATLTLTEGTLKLKDGVTSTVGSLVTTGAVLKYLESTTPGAQATIFDSAGTNTVTYLSIKDSNATGAAGFIATGPTNIDAGNNTNWIFGGAGGGNMFLMFM